MIVHLALLFTILFLCFIARKRQSRLNIVLILAFLAITVYLGLRYDYGLDYGAYQASFGSVSDDIFRSGEHFFITVLRSFHYYYQFIIFQTIILMASLFFFIKKNVRPELYYLFFFLFFTMNGMVFNMISAIRSTFSACIIWFALDVCWIQKKRILLYYLLVSSATLFHTSALVFYAFPFIFLLNRINYKSAFAVLIIADILSIDFTRPFFQLITQYESLSMYSEYDNTIENATIFGALHKAIWLFPAYYILKYSSILGMKERRVMLISFSYFFLFFMGATFQERFTTYLFPFVIYSISCVYNHLSKSERYITIVPIFIVCIITTCLFYYRMATFYVGYPGNYLEYKTIFDAPYFPY